MKLNNYLLTFVLVEYGCAPKGEAAKVVTYIKFVVLPVLAGTTVLHNFADDIGLTTVTVRLILSKNCHTGELTFPLLFTISSFAAALIFCL